MILLILVPVAWKKFGCEYNLYQGYNKDLFLLSSYVVLDYDFE